MQGQKMAASRLLLAYVTLLLMFWVHSPLLKLPWQKGVGSKVGGQFQANVWCYKATQKQTYVAFSFLQIAYFLFIEYERSSVVTAWEWKDANWELDPTRSWPPSWHSSNESSWHPERLRSGLFFSKGRQLTLCQLSWSLEDTKIRIKITK